MKLCLTPETAGLFTGSDILFTFGREKARVGVKTVALYAISVALCLLATLIYIYPSIQATNLMYKYSGKLKTLSELNELNKKIKLEISSLASYDLIEKRAVEELGFIFPATNQVVIIAKK
ncbi:hypothetical protein MNBD_NITROSPINAE04-1421 [hydrothermal vent metagenome]|uniref:Cell division protein FtsL n=1 Tax=hydrothermal vent metagenome TaxID=652676 RepID=A0A3B1C2N2_9ZZZZ